MPAIEGGEVTVASEEPLKRELADFVDAVVSRARRWSTGEDGRRALALAQQIADKMTTEMQPTRQHEATSANETTSRNSSRFRDFVATTFMYADLNDFLADLDTPRLLARVAEPVSPDLEIAAVTDRACKSPGGGPALLFEKPPASTCRSPTNVFGSMERMCLALGVKIARRPAPARSTS